MAKATHTTNPLHFEDLDPHRFEDLVRQLIYDFKDWRALEPTGRLGADEGYDARGFEIREPEEYEEEEENEDRDFPRAADRLWQIQCKREKTITPAKLKQYLDAMIPAGGDTPYGVICAAACDFSLQCRNVFRQQLSKKGVQEFHLWGKADLEDALFQPKNDHLLYGYFGISLVIRRRTVKSQIRSILATKRKAVRHLGPISQRGHLTVLVRDADDKDYPYIKAPPNPKKRPRWKMFQFTGHTHDGISVLIRRFPAYREIDYPKNVILRWDYTEEVNLALCPEDRWNKEDDKDGFRKAHDFLDSMPSENQAFFDIEGVIPYERIVEIDPLGDTIARCPHVFIDVPNYGFWDRNPAHLTPRGRFGPTIRVAQDDEKTRFKYFPDKFPNVTAMAPQPDEATKNPSSSPTAPQAKMQQ